MPKARFVIAGLILATTTLASGALAASKNQLVSLPKTQTVSGDYFAAGSSVNVSGTVNGDVYAAGGQVTVDGTVNGDILATGGTIMISGQIHGNVRAAGGQITISGPVDKNITLAGGTVLISNSSNIGGNAVIGGGNLDMAGKIAGNAKLGSGAANLTGNIGGNVETGAGQLTLGSGAGIGGYLTYWSNQTAQIDPGAKVAGTVTHKLPSSHHQNLVHRVNWFFALFRFGVILVLGLLLLLIFPNLTRDVARQIERRPWAALGLGLAWLVIIPIGLGILFITVLGIPAALIASFAYIVSLMLAAVWSAIVTGDLIARAFNLNNRAYIVLIIGAAVLTLLGLVPILGRLVVLASVLFGLGGAGLAGQKLYFSLRHNRQI